MGALRIAVLGIFLTASPAAIADSTTLLCDVDTAGHPGPAKIDLDEISGSVTVYYPPTSMGGGTVLPSSLYGKFAATFSPKTIIFVDKDGSSRTIDRLTGILIWQGNARNPVTSTWICHVGQKQF